MAGAGQPPRSPTRNDKDLDRIITKLNLEHALDLTTTSKHSSGLEGNHQRGVLMLLQFLHSKNSPLLEQALSEFDTEAVEIRSGWVHKPKADADLLPQRTNRFATHSGTGTAIGLREQESLRSLLFSKLDNAEKQHFTPKTHSIPFCLSQEHHSPVGLEPLETEPNPLSLPGSSVDETFRYLNTQSFDVPSEQAIDNTQSVDEGENLGSDTDEVMTDADDFHTPPQSPSERQHLSDLNFHSMAKGNSGAIRKRGSPDTHNEGSSRKRSMQYPDISAPLFQPNQSYLPIPAIADTSYAASSVSSDSVAMTSANTSFTTDTTSVSFGDWKGQDQTRDHVTTRANQSSPKRSRTERGTDLGGQSIYLVSDQGREATSIPGPTTNRNGLAAKSFFRKQLNEHSPFDTCLNVTPQHVPFRIAYEVNRIALDSNVPTENLYQRLTSLDQSRLDDYDYLWSELTSVAAGDGKITPEKSHIRAWQAARSTCERIAFKAELSYTKADKGPFFHLKLHPLAFEDSYRLARRFGFDRFITLNVPDLAFEDLKHVTCGAELAREAIVEWLINESHFLLGREWQAFLMKPKPSKKKPAAGSSVQWRVYLFATNGHGFEEFLGGTPGTHAKISLVDMLKFFLPFDENLESPALKLFARLPLAVSSTVATLTFGPHQMVRCRDSYSTAPGIRRLSPDKIGSLDQAPIGKVMSDGCARISQQAARMFAELLGVYNHVPSAFQARIGGAKGVWVVDTLGELLHNDPVWIEVADSQLKFEGPSIDKVYQDARRSTFEVRAKPSPLKPAMLNFQLMPILIDRGVSRKVFIQRLEEDIEEKASDLSVSMDSSLSLRAWNQENNPVSTFRMAEESIRYEGGLPKSISEQINAFTESGFSPKSCHFLNGICHDTLKRYCARLEERMHIEIGRSTYALMVPDFRGVLGEDEIHLGFSSKFTDSGSGFCDTMLHGCEVLVARMPAALPSDVHRVKAVFHPELAMLKDVVVFPTRGKFSLAEKLSGGDFDGDLGWICWDPEIVESFQNYDMPEAKAPEWYGISKDKTLVKDLYDCCLGGESKFVRDFLFKGFLFTMNKSLLGICTKYHESYCYDLAKNRPEGSMQDPRAIEIGQLLGLLVDTAKNGYTFTWKDWKAYKSKIKVRQHLEKPAYKENKYQDFGHGEDAHVIDHLVCFVAKKVRQQIMQNFEERFPANNTEKDADLLRIIKEEEAAAESDPDLKQVLANLRSQFKELHEQYVRTNDLQRRDKITFGAHADQLRSAFLQIRPKLSDPAAEPPKSSLVRRWVEESDNPSREFATMGSWTSVKASALYRREAHKSSVPWYACGEELMAIKVTSNGKRHSLTKEAHHSMKIYRRVLERKQQRQAAIAKVLDSENVLPAELDADEFMSQDYVEAFEALSWAE